MNSILKQRAINTLATTLLIGGVSIGSASVASAAEGDLSAFGDAANIASVEANVNLNNNNNSLLDANADANLKLGDNSVLSPVTAPVKEATADVNFNLAQPSTVSPSRPLTQANADVYLGSPYVAPVAPVPAAPVPAPVAPVPAAPEAVSAPAAEVSVALNAATNTVDTVLRSLTGDNQGGITGTLVDGTANIRIGNLQPGQQYDFLLYSDNSADGQPGILGTYTADADGVVLLALPAGFGSSGDGSGEGLLEALGVFGLEGPETSAADSVTRIVVFPGGTALLNGNSGGDGTTGNNGSVDGETPAEDIAINPAFNGLDTMVGWIDPETGTNPGGNPAIDEPVTAVPGNGGDSGAGNGSGVPGDSNNGTVGLETGVLANHGTILPASATNSGITSTGINAASTPAQTRGVMDALANTGAANMAIFATVGGILLAAGVFLLRRRIGINA